LNVFVKSLSVYGKYFPTVTKKKKKGNSKNGLSFGNVVNRKIKGHIFGGFKEKNKIE